MDSTSAADGGHQADGRLQRERVFMDEYEMLETVDGSTWGRVWKAMSRQTGSMVAIRTLRNEEMDGVSPCFLREINMLKRTSHEHIVKLLDYHATPRYQYIVFELFTRNVRELVSPHFGKRFSLDPNDVKSMALQLNRGVDVCHARGIMLQNLATEHLLLDEQFRLKISNFCFARSYITQSRNEEYPDRLSSRKYRAPELLLGAPLYSVPIDLWSIGCILGEMATSAPLFWGDSEIGTLFQIFKKLGTPTSSEWPAIDSEEELPFFKKTFPKWTHRGWGNIRNTEVQLGQDGIDLLGKFLAYDPAKRISVRCALQHPYFSNVELPTSTL